MEQKIKKTLHEEYNRLKKVFEKIMKPGNEPMPQLLLQPVRNKKNLRENDSR